MLLNVVFGKKAKKEKGTLDESLFVFPLVECLLLGFCLWSVFGENSRPVSRQAGTTHLFINMVCTRIYMSLRSQIMRAQTQTQSWLEIGPARRSGPVGFGEG